MRGYLLRPFTGAVRDTGRYTAAHRHHAGDPKKAGIYNPELQQSSNRHGEILGVSSYIQPRHRGEIYFKTEIQKQSTRGTATACLETGQKSGARPVKALTRHADTEAPKPRRHF